MIENVVFLIPARRNSKGFKFKNRKLIDFTLNSIPKEYLSMVYIAILAPPIFKRIMKSKVYQWNDDL